MSVHYRDAENAKEIAALLHNRGRTVITAPPRCGKTTELIRYAENRYPNGRFAVVAHPDKHGYITKLHWLIYNELTQANLVASRLLGKELEGEEVRTPYLMTAESVMYRAFSKHTPIFVDEFQLLPENARRVIIKHKLFIAAVATKGESYGTEES